MEKKPSKMNNSPLMLKLNKKHIPQLLFRMIVTMKSSMKTLQERKLHHAMFLTRFFQTKMPVQEKRKEKGLRRSSAWFS